MNARYWLWRIAHPREAHRIARRLRFLAEVNQRIDMEDAIMNRLLAQYRGFPDA